MTLDKIRELLKCNTGSMEGKRPLCFECQDRSFCDDITRVIMKWKSIKEPAKSHEEKQQDLLKDPTKRY